MVTALLRRTPLRVKLVAALLALAAVALGLISVASTVALRSYLTGRIDAQLDVAAPQLVTIGWTRTIGEVPSNFITGWHNGARWQVGQHYPYPYTEADLPPLPSDHAEALEVAGRPYTATGHNGETRWRLLVTPLENGHIYMVGQSLASVDQTVTRLIWVEVLVGSAVLLLVGVVGTGIVRASLQPLIEIEQTAGAIAAGDLTRRVPDPEPYGEAPQTELGRLGRALNAMLAQIEMAFTARTASEAAARAAEEAARSAAQAAQDSEARARRSEERMRRFVADASHELRTPLTSIRGFAELYRQGAVTDPDDIGRLVRRIEDEAARMGLLVEDLLLLARLDRERPLDLSPVELPVVAGDAVHAARAVDPGRPIELEVCTGGQPLVVWGDDARLRQVVGNLLSNALTHTPPGTRVVVRLRTEPGALGEGPVAVLEVADEGPGLAPEQAERVFERFYRVDSARTRPAGTATEPEPGRRAAPGGTGLGLAIVAALVRAHQGTVTVDSALGRGATFRVALPLAPEEPAAAEPPEVTENPGVPRHDGVAARDIGTGQTSDREGLTHERA